MKRKHKRIIILACLSTLSVITIILPIYFIQSQTSSLNHDLIIKVGQYDNEPKIYENEQGKVVGLFPEILEYIADLEGWKIEWVYGTWTECLERLENGTIDIMVDVAYSEAREELYDFNNVEVLNNWGIIYQKTGVNINSIEDLQNKRVAVMSGSIHTEGEGGIKNLVKKWGVSCTFIEVESYEDVFSELDNGNAEAGVANRIFGLINEKDYNIERTSIMFNPSRLLFAFPKNAELNPTIIPKIDEHLLAMKQDTDSLYYQAIDEYIYGYEGGRIPTWVYPVLFIAFTLVGVFVFSSYVLKRMVDNRTADLKKAHKELEMKVEERTRELSKANERLKGLDQLKSMFIANMSHELRTPLTSIIGFSRTLLKGWGGEINEEQEKQLSIILNSANHLLELINDIIDLSKIETGKIDIQKSTFDIVEMAKSLIKIFSVQCENKQVRLLLDSPDELTIFNDEKRVNQILVNLVGNAVKFTDDGKIVIIIRDMGESITIKVKDTGTGIKEEDIDKLFKAFSRIIESGKFREGTGLGLHYSQQLARLLGGNISVESEYGKGSIFTLSLKKEEIIKNA